MRKIWLVFKREYLTRVRSKGFILSTIGLPLFAVGVLALSVGLATRKTDHTLKISLLDNLGGFGSQIAAGLEGKLPGFVWMAAQNFCKASKSGCVNVP